MKVVGVYGQDFPGADIYAYISKAEAKKAFDLTEADLNLATEIVVRTQGKGGEESVVQVLESFNIPYDINPWQEKLGLIQQFTNSLLVISNLTEFVGAVIAFATIYILISINILQRKSQIGVLKAIGISRETILGSYLIQSVVYGLGGILAGFVITGVVLYYFTANPIQAPMGDIFPVVSFAAYVKSTFILLASSLVAGYAAAYRVVKEPILKSIFGGYG